MPIETINRVPLTDCATVPQPESYLRHIVFHMNEVINAPGATSLQKARAAQIITALSNLKVHLDQALVDIQQLITLDDAHFPSSPLLFDLEQQTGYVSQGWFDASTQQMHPGARIIHLWANSEPCDL